MIVKTIVKSFLLTCANEWFIPSLFISRLFVWGIIKVKSLKFQLSIAVALCVIGVVLYDVFPRVSDIWYYKHALMVIIFMFAGVVMKGRVIPHGYQISCFYILLLVILLMTGSGVPYITNRVNVALWQIPLVLLLAFSGIVMILKISQNIDSNLT